MSTDLVQKLTKTSLTQFLKEAGEEVAAKNENWELCQLSKTCLTLVPSELALVLRLKILQNVNQSMQDYVKSVFDLAIVVGYACTQDQFTQTVFFNLQSQYSKLFCFATRPTTLMQLLNLVTEIEHNITDCSSDPLSLDQNKEI
ncbi:hypothetical protein PR048_021583 [Dryococelus australis]|uniref:Uncharacterized protein n=1 Tax=Dryococelus australis TaxID=614101 RepID=A0ABQ9GYM9_9NEOP|nr:hypothetical protein PR048_021583 [Dryococelus australis]